MRQSLGHILFILALLAMAFLAEKLQRGWNASKGSNAPCPEVDLYPTVPYQPPGNANP